MNNVKDYFLKYVKYNTQSAFDAGTAPSTPGQSVLAQVIWEDCKKIGLEDAEICQGGVVMASLPENNAPGTPVIGFIAHMDTSPDFSGEGVNPQVIDYQGGDIVLQGRVISPDEFPILLNYKGQEIITADGATLLGADDKAGIAEIMAAMEYLACHKEIPHGKIRVAFTPDEEIGHGTDHFDVEKFGADFAYTLDGGEIGEFEMESFNAARAKIKITGKSVHPGTAKGIMVNALLVAMELAGKFPEKETPAATEGREGFYHLTRISGGVEEAQIEYILRDHSKEGFMARKDFVVNAVWEINKKYGDIVILNLYDEYYNMYEILKDKPRIRDYALKAMEAARVKPHVKPIRGGTDGSRLSFMGLPCPNLFAGGHNFHGPYEFVPVPSMRKAAEVVVHICKLAAGKS